MYCCTNSVFSIVDLVSLEPRDTLIVGQLLMPYEFSCTKKKTAGKCFKTWCGQRLLQSAAFHFSGSPTTPFYFMVNTFSFYRNKIKPRHIL